MNLLQSHDLFPPTSFLGIPTWRDDAKPRPAAEKDAASMHAMLDLAPDGIFAADATGRCTYVNAAFCALVGQARPDVGGRAFIDFLPGEEADRLRATPAKPRGGVEAGEWKLRRNDGAHVPVELRVSQLPGGGWLGFLRDISARQAREAERRAAFEEVQREQRRLRTMLDAFPLGVVVSGADGSLSANQPAEDLLGTRFSPEGGSAEYAGLIFHPDGRSVAPSERVDARVLQEGRPVIGAEYLVRRPDGTELPLLVSAAPVRDDDGKVVGALSVLQDISERVKLDRAVRENERLFHAVFDLVPVGLWIADAQGRIVLGNRAGSDIWQGIRHLGPEEFGQYQGWWVDSGLPIAPDEWGIARAVDRGETSLSELIRIQCFDGSRKTVINWAAPLRDDAGTITGAVAVNEDVTALHQTQEQLRAAVREREHILAVVSHDLRSPLGAIKLRAALVEQKAGRLAGGDELRLLATEIREITRGMSGLVGDLLAVSAARQGHSMMERVRAAPALILARAAEVARPMLAQAGLQLVVEPPGELPPVHVDLDRILRVFANLLDNASKFTESGGRVDLRAAPARGAVLFTVTNSGPPLHKDQMEHLFQPFWQAGRDDSRGAGLGLSICRAIVDSHGGSIWAEAAEGMQVKICVLLPCVRPAAQGMGGSSPTARSESESAAAACTADAAVVRSRPEAPRCFGPVTRRGVRLDADRPVRGGAAMNVATLCPREIVTVPASASVREAAAVMRDEHVGALAVTDPYAPDRVIGIVTDRDLVVDLLAGGLPIDRQAVGAIARTELAGVPADASIHHAVQAMQRSGVRRLLIMGKDNAVVGLVSADDLLGAVAGELDALAATLRGGVLHEGSRKPASARAAGEPPRTLYIARNEP